MATDHVRGREALPGANVRLWQDHLWAADALVVRSGLQELKVVGCVLTLDRPWPLRADLRALALGRA